MLRPLAGKRIVVTRARSQASSLVEALGLLGAEVIELPTIETVPLDCYDRLDEALKQITQYQWLIVTSANTVRVLGDRIHARSLDPSGWAGLRKVAIGSATARAMLERGLGADVIPNQYVAESLVEALGDQVRGSRILLARAEVARDLIPDELTRRGATVDVVNAYRTVLPPGAADLLQTVFSESKPPDAVTFTSSSTVKNFLTLWQEAGFKELSPRPAAFSIGPATSQALREAGWEPTAEAVRHDVEGLVQAVCAKWSA